MATPGDHRADIFAFGCVLYEMLAGRKAFEGASVVTAIAAIMSSEPPPIAALQSAHPLLDHVMRRCLEKDRERRWQSIGDVTGELRWIADHPCAVPAACRPAAAIEPRSGVAAMAVALVARDGRRGRRSARPARTEAPRRIFPRSASRSPRRPPTIRRWRCRRTARRSRSSPTRIACPCSGSARSTPSRAARCRARKAPAFRSGRRTAARIGFFADDKLKRIDVAGGRAAGRRRRAERAAAARGTPTA